MDAGLQAEIINFAVVIATALVGYATRRTVQFLKKKGIVADIQNSKELAVIAVTAVEQAYAHLEGAERFNLAKIELVELANKKGIKITEQELNLLIESTVKEMNKVIKQEVKK